MSGGATSATSRRTAATAALRPMNESSRSRSRYGCVGSLRGASELREQPVRVRSDVAREHLRLLRRSSRRTVPAGCGAAGRSRRSETAPPIGAHSTASMRAPRTLMRASALVAERRGG